ncbi:hypothetical protein ACFFOM_18065 [Microlunatus capsulatus]|uniref:Uncharacterized protein n=1 Tax=Microlunatus capsulatus TaxID=99117 RepID=A0ABS4ZD37_9ACTN|nr:hypothetical protein [Microlunatus capsulatus]MBP2418911.1 hypothetical protein [Microlunatus capsulatus]
MTGSPKGPATKRQLQAIEEMTLKVGEKYQPRSYTGMEASLEIRRLDSRIESLMDDGTLPPPTWEEAANAYIPEPWELTEDEKRKYRCRVQEVWDEAMGSGPQTQ